MKITLGEWFPLPRLGPDIFIRLVRQLHLKYDKEKGFKADQETDLASVAAVLQSVLGEPVEAALKCFVCDRIVECETCPYEQSCDRLRISAYCLCNACRAKTDTFELYTLKLASMRE